MRTPTEIQGDINILTNQISQLQINKKLLERELDESRRAKQKNSSASRKALEEKSKNAFSKIVKPGSIVRVVGARSYPWKYVISVNGDTFTGIGISMRTIRVNHGKKEYLVSLSHDSISTTMFSKCRDHLTKEEFEKVFATKLLTP